uniref:Uncharacterized protein n=1 Tax=Glossina pallidipes TaxID=7398 RepID=A0A1B0AFG3_GLOPL
MSPGHYPMTALNTLVGNGNNSFFEPTERNARDEIVKIYLIFHRTQQDEQFCYMFVTVWMCSYSSQYPFLMLFKMTRFRINVEKLTISAIIEANTNSKTVQAD